MVVVVRRKCSLAQVQLYMSKAFEEIWHFRKSLGNSRNGWIFLNCLGICRKCYLFDNAQILGNGTLLVKNYFKTKLGYPNLTSMPPITGASLKFSLTGSSTP